MGQASGQSKLALWSMICGIIGLLCFGVILGIVAIVLGLQGRKQIEASGGRMSGGGMATAGIVLGVVDIAVFVLYLAVLRH